MFRLLLLAMLLPIGAWAQPCSTTNGTNCVCADGSNSCDLLPDLSVSWHRLLYDTPEEFSQTGNGPDNGLLKITGTLPNLGYGLLEVAAVDTFICGNDTVTSLTNDGLCADGSYPRQMVLQRIYQKNGDSITYRERFAGYQTFHFGHGHHHTEDLLILTLRTEDPNEPDTLKWPIVAQSLKIDYCLMDVANCSAWPGTCRTSHVYSYGSVITNVNIPNFGMGGGQYSCNPLKQGVSVGYADVYGKQLEGMWINIPPGICNGNYWLVAEVDPLNLIEEMSDANNWTAVPLTLTKQNPNTSIVGTYGKYLCNGTPTTLTATAGQNFQWSTGDTTQTITVSSPGTYALTVSSVCGIDSVSFTLQDHHVDTPIVTIPSVCRDSQVTLTAMHNSQIVQWFSSENGVTAISNQSSITWRKIPYDSVVYVQSADLLPDAVQYCTSERIAVNVTVEPTPDFVFGNLDTFYLDTDSPIQLTAQPGGGTFSGRGITVDGNNRTYFSPALAGAGDSIAITYEYTSPLGCPADTVVYITILHNPGSGLTSITDNQLLFHPNPATATVTIVQPTPTVSALSFYDAAGKLALTAEVNGLRSVVDVSNLAKGLYLMRLDGAFGSRYGKLSKL